jgi:hypothetical protein
VYIEPWSDINEYPTNHSCVLKTELQKELSKEHVLNDLSIQVLAKREDCDELLIFTEKGYFIVHLTWSGKTEPADYPITERYQSLEQLKLKLAKDAEYY